MVLKVEGTNLVDHIDDQLWFHHPEMQERIRRAEEELADEGNE